MLDLLIFIFAGFWKRLYDISFQTIAKRLTESKQTIPHYYLSIDVNLDKTLAWVSILLHTMCPYKWTIHTKHYDATKEYSNCTQSFSPGTHRMLFFLQNGLISFGQQVAFELVVKNL